MSVGSHYPPAVLSHRQNIVAVCVGDPMLQRLLRSVATKLLPTATTFYTSLPDVLSSNQRYSCIICILDVTESAANKTIRILTRAAPNTPVLVYAPLKPNVEHAIRDLASCPYVTVMLQFAEHDEEERLLRMVIHLVRTALVGTVDLLLLSLFRNAPDLGRVAVDHTLAHLARNSVPTVRSIAHEMRMSERSLERSWQHCQFPPPGELISWTSLLYVVLLAERSGTSTSGSAIQVGISKQRLYRIRRRLLSDSSRSSIRMGADELHITILEFARRYRVPSSQAADVFNQIRVG